MHVPVIAITANPSSTVARAARAVIDASVDHELCPHDTVPTTSALAAQALGDALSMAAMRARGVSPDDLTRVHPGSPPPRPTEANSEER
jgi:arabinose-5-phosphate isomerase